MIKMGSFRSYVDLEEYEMKIPTPAGSTLLQPQFIPGELVIAEATNVLKFTSLSKTKGLSGSLFVTNARVVFVSSDHVCSEDSFPLLSINSLWYYESSSKVSSSSSSSSVKKTRRRVKLGPMRPNSFNSSSGLSSSSTSLSSPATSLSSHLPSLLSSSGSTRIHEIFLVCSNFRTLRISFKFSPIDQGLRVCNAIIHHSFPDQIERLFYFDFCKAYNAQWTSASRGGGAIGGGSDIGVGLSGRSFLTIPSYLDKGDWLRELNVTRVPSGSFRISGLNEGFAICSSLPEWLVVPSEVNEVRLRSLAEKLKGSRPPHWSWGDSRGASILIMGKLHNEAADSAAENAFFEALRKGHPKTLAPVIYDLDSVVTLKELRVAFVALVELCCPESFATFQESDSKFYSLLEYTRWPGVVSKTLAKVAEVVETLSGSGAAVILQEQEGRDVACLFSSLAQLVVDPRFRTVTGFFSLVQKDWVAFGHPFHSTHMHTSPVFLLFLDAVFQLLSQNPAEFEFNERLLSAMWDSSFDCTTGTFLFDSPKQRKNYELCKDSTAWVSILFSSTSTEVPSSPPPPTSSRGGGVPRREVMSVKSVIPRVFLNPFFQVRALLIGGSSGGSLLSPPRGSVGGHPLIGLASSPTNNNTQTLPTCSPIMCDIAFWEALYLNRMVEATPSIVTNNSATDLKFGSTPLPDSSPSPASSASSPTPSPSSKFYFPLVLPPSTDNFQRRRPPGRDTLKELGLIDDLLANLSATAPRFQRHHVPSTSYTPPSSSTGVLSSAMKMVGSSSGFASSGGSSISSGNQQHQHRMPPRMVLPPVASVHHYHLNRGRMPPLPTVPSRPLPPPPTSAGSASSPRRNPFLNLNVSSS